MEFAKISDARAAAKGISNESRLIGRFYIMSEKNLGIKFLLKYEFKICHAFPLKHIFDRLFSLYDGVDSHGDGQRLFRKLVGL